MKLLLCICLLIFAALPMPQQEQKTRPTGRIVFTDHLFVPPYGYTVDVFDLDQWIRYPLQDRQVDNFGTEWTIDDENVYAESCFQHEIYGYCYPFLGVVTTREKLHIYELLRPNWQQAYGELALSPDGNFVAFLREWNFSPSEPLGWDAHVMNIRTGEIRDLLSDQRSDGRYLSWSFDSRYLAFSCRRGSELCISDVIENRLYEFQFGDFHVGNVIWSPNGEQIALVIANRKIQELAVFNWQSRELHRLSPISSSPESLVWSPDSTHLAFFMRAGDQGYQDTFSIRVDGKNFQNLSRTPNAWESDVPEWSPDSRWVAYFSAAGSETWLTVTNIESLQTYRLTTNDTIAVSDVPDPVIYWLPSI